MNILDQGKQQTTGGDTGGGAPPLTPKLQGHIGRQLRAAYSQLVHEPMPDKFTKLIEELAAAQKKTPHNRDRE